MVDRKNLRIMINIVLKYKELTYLKDKLLLSENDISTLLSFMFELTPTGFEHYIGEYLKTIQKFDNIIFTGGYKDKGIDIKGKKDGYLYAIQCKKY